MSFASVPSKAGAVSRLEKLFVGLIQPGEESVGFDKIRSSAAVERGLQAEGRAPLLVREMAETTDHSGGHPLHLLEDLLVYPTAKTYSESYLQ